MSRVVPCWVRNRGRQRERQRPLNIGQRIRHESGVTVEIVNGQLLGGYGRISNFWYWREVLPDGSFGRKGHGYGFVKNGILTGGEWEETV